VAIRKVRERFRVSPARYPRDVADIRRATALAMERLGRKEWLLDAGPSVADIALATMSAPLAVDPALRAEPEIAALLAWGERLLPPDVVQRYRRSPTPSHVSTPEELP
jgi:glutathione S-transferase